MNEKSYKIICAFKTQDAAQVAIKFINKIKEDENSVTNLEISLFKSEVNKNLEGVEEVN